MLLIKQTIKGIFYLIATFFLIGSFTRMSEQLIRNTDPLKELTKGEFIIVLIFLVSAYIVTTFLKTTSIMKNEKDKKAKKQ
jgi:hypothetical protein